MNTPRITTEVCERAEAAQDWFRAKARPLLPPAVATEGDAVIQAVVTCAATADLGCARAVRLIRRAIDPAEAT